MRGYIKSATKTFDIGDEHIAILDWTSEQIDTSISKDVSKGLITSKRYRVTVAEIEDYDETTLLRIRRANLRNVKNAQWNGSKIIKNETA